MKPSDIATFLKDNIYSPLFLAVVLLTLLAIPSVGHLSFPQLGFVAIPFSAFLIYWLILRRAPRTPKDRVGFALAIITENRDYDIRLRNDFVSKLRSNLDKNERPKYCLLDFNEYHSKRVIDRASAAKYLRNTRATFIMYGAARIRTIEGKEQHVLTWSGMASDCKNDDPAIQAKLEGIRASVGKDIAMFMPTKLHFEGSNELLAFEVSAELIDIAIEFIIARVLFYSYSFHDCASALENVSAKLKAMKGAEGLAPIKAMSSSLPDRLSEAYLCQMVEINHRWRLSRDSKLLVALADLGEKLNTIKPGHHQSLIARSIRRFVEGDIDGALEDNRQVMETCKGEDASRVARLNVAFLQCYKGNVKSSLVTYQKAAKDLPNRVVIMDCEHFVQGALEKEPSKSQLHLCLAELNYRGKGDLMLAREQYQAFLEKADRNNAQLRGAIDHAEHELKEIEKELTDVPDQRPDSPIDLKPSRPDIKLDV